ncbi:MAG TPA: hypothetical protein VMH27_12940 [Puia sp.]|nr:hypothetical protein [Puia sp.]
MNAVTLAKPVYAFLLSVLLGGHTSGSADVKYIPVTDSRGIFNVVYDNATGSKFVVRITDQDGNQIYQGTFSDKKFSRNFQLADPEGYSRLVFEIRSLGDHTSQRFEVETQTHLIEDVTVREVQ